MTEPKGSTTVKYEPGRKVEWGELLCGCGHTASHHWLGHDATSYVLKDCSERGCLCKSFTEVMEPKGSSKMKKVRTCHYCEQPKCRCTYRYGRRGLSAMQVWNTSRQTTARDMQREFAEIFAKVAPETPLLFSISMTKINPATPYVKPKRGK